MAMTWTTLVGASTVAGSIARWVNRRDLATGDAQDILDETISWIGARLRHWRQLSTPQSLTMTVGADQIAVPADLQEPDFMMISGLVSGQLYRTEIKLKLPNVVYRAWAYDQSGTRLQGIPIIYSFKYESDQQHESE